MNTKISARNIGYLYLLIVPLLVIVSGFGIGKINYTIYLPVWIINIVLMFTASWFLGLHIINKKTEKKHLATGSFFLIVPWMLVSMFFGLGPPPDSITGWVATATEQQVRYSMLTVAGIFIALGFTLLKEKLKNEGETYYSLLGFVIILISSPLFILTILFWGFSMTESFKMAASINAEKLPDWFKPTRLFFDMISLVEVALTYLATAFFAVSMKRAGWLRNIPSMIYVLISLLAFIIIVLSAFIPGPFVTAGYAVSIPAIPFLMPYYLGVYLLRRAGN